MRIATKELSLLKIGFDSRSGAPALERNALEAPASTDTLGRPEPPRQCVPRLEPRNKGWREFQNSDRRTR